jgi:hypothetical protein
MQGTTFRAPTVRAAASFVPDIDFVADVLGVDPSVVRLGRADFVVMHSYAPLVYAEGHGSNGKYYVEHRRDGEGIELTVAGVTPTAIVRLARTADVAIVPITVAREPHALFLQAFDLNRAGKQGFATYSDLREAFIRAARSFPVAKTLGLYPEGDQVVRSPFETWGRVKILYR